MAEVQVLGIGAWSERFATWRQLVDGLVTGLWQSAPLPRPALIAPKDLRRTPKPVRIAIEVMNQACDLATFRPDAAATVFSSSMGDMDITDYMCRVLADIPLEISPTRFHNSVHNAATGYWSIATESRTPATAVSAGLHTAPAGLLEAAIQVVEEDIPVLLVSQEMTTPLPLRDTCPSRSDCALALLLAPTGQLGRPMASVSFEVRRAPVRPSALPASLNGFLDGHPGAALLPLLAAIAPPAHGEPATVRLPLSDRSGLELTVTTDGCRG